MSLTVRHVTRGLGVLPQDVTREACSGLVGVALGIAQAQAERGYRAQVLGWNPQAQASSWNIGPVEAYATRGWNWATVGNYDFRFTAPMLLLASRLGAAHVLHAYSDPHLLLPPRATKRVLHYQTPIPENPPSTYTYLVNRADAVVCCGEFIKNQFLSRVDYPTDRVYDLPNGIDLRRFESSDRLRFRDEWSISVETPVVLFTGALVPEKGLLYLLRAAAELRDEHDFEIVVAGNSALWQMPGHAGDTPENEYLRLVGEAASGLKIHWLGAVPLSDMPDVYAAADICVCPSAWDDPFPLVACEAMAAGKPIIASRRGGLPQIVVEGETGLLVPSEDVAALKSALTTVLTNNELALRMGRRAKERSRSFSWTSVAARLHEIYEELGAPPEAHKSRAPGSYAG